MNFDEFMELKTTPEEFATLLVNLIKRPIRTESKNSLFTLNEHFMAYMGTLHSEMCTAVAIHDCGGGVH